MRGDPSCHAPAFPRDDRGKPGGKLAERRVALKDNVCLAGVPMMVGANFLEGSVPDIDATMLSGKRWI